MNKPTMDAALMSRVQALLAQRDARKIAAAHPGLQLTAHADGPAEMLLYDEISWWGISAQDVADALADVHGDLHVKINSPGGDVFDGLAIYNMLADHPGQVTVTIDGLAASAASFIAMAGDQVTVNRGAQVMIHDASGLCYGNASDMAEMVGLLDRISDTIAGIYAGHAGGEAGTWRDLMRAETWYDGPEAVLAGLADEAVSAERQAAPDEPADRALVARWDLSVFQYAGRDQAPAPDAPPPPVAVQSPSSPQAEPGPAPAPPAPEPVAVEPAPEPQPDPWAAATAHLITPPSTEDVWESLKEALLR